MAINWVNVQPGEWTWLEDYVYTGSAKYAIGCPWDRKCRIGSGIFIDGMPRGSQAVFSGDIEWTVVGLGALHVKIEDTGGPCRIGFFRISADLLVTIYPKPKLPRM